MDISAWMICVFLLLNFLTAEATGAARTVMLAGRFASGTDNARFAASPNIRFRFNDAGSVAFVANLQHSNGRVTDTNDFGIWLDRGAFGTRLVAREGDRPSGLPTSAKFTEWFESLELSNLDEVAFSGYAIEGAGGVNSSNDSGVWIYRNAVQQLVAREGQRPPGSMLNETFGGFLDLAMSKNGSLGYFGYVDNSSSSSSYDLKGLWQRGAGGNQSVVARDGNPAPGFPAGSTLSVLPYDYEVDGGNQIAFTGTVRLNSSSEHGLWLYSPGISTQLIARGGSAAPGIAPGTEFEFFQRAQFVEPNRLVVKASLQLGTGGATTANDTGIWLLGAGGAPSMLVAREGQHAPGFPADVFFGSLDELQLLANEGGGIVFNATVFRSEQEQSVVAGRGFWRMDADGELERLDFAEASIPGMKSTETLELYLPVNMNRSGQLAFSGALLRPRDEPWESTAIFVQDRGGNLRMVARVGDEIDVDSGLASDLRTIESLDFDESSFNDAGEFAFAAYFTDGSAGIFVSDIGTMLLGDYNHNGSVGPEDYATWKASFGTKNLAADGNGDGVVDAADYAVWRDNLGRSVAGIGAASLTVPEPETAQIAWAIVGAIWIFVRGQRV